MKVIIEPGKSRNIIATIAIGESYYQDWQRYASPSWKKYCEHHGLGLVVFDKDMLSKNDPFWKKATWQKFLIGDQVAKKLPFVKNICYLDTDFIISPLAPNVFDSYNENSIGLVSARQNIPYPYKNLLRRIAFLRHVYYSKAYPLDSALFMSLDDWYKHHNLPVQQDEACAGFFIINLSRHAQLMKSIFEQYDQSIYSMSSGGDEIHFNYELQKHGEISWFDYRYQALWIYEIAWKYPFLYSAERNNNMLIRQCIESSLFTNFFIHFAGSWYESDMWKIEGILQDARVKEQFEGFNKYLQIPVTGTPKGRILPRSDNLQKRDVIDES